MKHKSAQKKQKHARPTLYGLHAVREAWLNEERDVHALYLTPQSQNSFEKEIHEARKNGLNRPQPQIIDKHQVEKMLPKGVVHQGIALSCSPAPEYDIQDFIIRADTEGKSAIAILDQVTDPHNVGAILRSASAFGLDGIIMQKKHAPELDGVLAKTACGAVDHMPVAKVTNLSRAIEELQESGFFVIGLDEHSDQNINQIESFDKTALVLGSEGEGIRRLIREKCDHIVKLPTQGRIASLNVSNAAAVTFFTIKNR